MVKVILTKALFIALLATSCTTASSYGSAPSHGTTSGGYDGKGASKEPSTGIRIQPPNQNLLPHEPTEIVKPSSDLLPPQMGGDGCTQTADGISCSAPSSTNPQQQGSSNIPSGGDIKDTKVPPSPAGKETKPINSEEAGSPSPSENKINPSGGGDNTTNCVKNGNSTACSSTSQSNTINKNKDQGESSNPPSNCNVRKNNTTSPTGPNSSQAKEATDKNDKPPSSGENDTDKSKGAGKGSETSPASEVKGDKYDRKKRSDQTSLNPKPSK